VPAVYQFMPHWRAGLRYDLLSADNDVVVTSLSLSPSPIHWKCTLNPVLMTRANGPNAGA